MWELDHKEGWTMKNWCFWAVVLEKTLESPLDCKEIKPVNLKGNLSWIFIQRTVVEAEAPILWHSASFMVQCANPYMTTGKTIALTIWSFVGKVMSLVFNTVSSFVIQVGLYRIPTIALWGKFYNPHVLAEKLKFKDRGKTSMLLILLNIMFFIAMWPQNRSVITTHKFNTLLNIYILSFQPRPTQSEKLGSDPCNLRFNRPWR